MMLPNTRNEPWAAIARLVVGQQADMGMFVAYMTECREKLRDQLETQPSERVAGGAAMLGALLTVIAEAPDRAAGKRVEADKGADPERLLHTRRESRV